METYAVVYQIKPGGFAGQVRGITQGLIEQCSHRHRSRSVALECAEKMLSRA